MLQGWPPSKLWHLVNLRSNTFKSQPLLHRVVDLALYQAAKPWKAIFRCLGTICGGLFPKMYRGTNLQPCSRADYHCQQRQQWVCTWQNWCLEDDLDSFWDDALAHLMRFPNGLPRKSESFEKHINMATWPDNNQHLPKNPRQSPNRKEILMIACWQSTLLNKKYNH